MRVEASLARRPFLTVSGLESTQPVVDEDPSRRDTWKNNKLSTQYCIVMSTAAVASNARMLHSMDRSRRIQPRRRRRFSSSSSSSCWIIRRPSVTTICLLVLLSFSSRQLEQVEGQQTSDDDDDIDLDAAELLSNNEATEHNVFPDQGKQYSEPMPETEAKPRKLDGSPSLDEPDTSPTPEPDYDKQDLPQPPAKEQIEEPVVDAAAAVVQEEAKVVPTVFVDDGDDDADSAAVADEPDAAPTPDPSSEPLSDDDKQDLPQPPAKEQIEEPVVDAAAIGEEQAVDDGYDDSAAVVDEPDAAPTPDPSSEPEPPTPLQDDDPVASSEVASDAEEETVAAFPESLPVADSAQVETGVETDDASEQKPIVRDEDYEDLPSDDNYSSPTCGGVWGDYSFARRRPADMSILYQLFRDVEEGAPWLKSNRDEPKQFRSKTKDNTSTDNPPTQQEDTTAPETSETDNEKPTAETQGSKMPTTKSNDFVAGLDDIDDLFEGIDAPDELDVGSDGSSFQEVLMGSATRVLIKRVSIGARIVKEKLVRITDHLVDGLRDENCEIKPLRRLRNQDGDLAPFRALRNENGEFAPLRILRDDDGDWAPFRKLRNDNGEFAPLRKLRDEDGDFSLPSKEQVLAVCEESARDHCQAIP